MSCDQTLSVNQHRYALLEVFCQYDLGNLSVSELELRMKEMNIKPTQAYRGYMRKHCGTLKFNEFVKVLSTSDDHIIDEMMSSATDSSHSPDLHQSRGVGLFNTTLSRYSKTDDFLKWKSAADIHRNEAAADVDTTEFETNRRGSVHSRNVQHIFSPQTAKGRVSVYAESMQSTEDAAQCTDIKQLIQLYCRGSIDVYQFEAKIKAQGIEMNAQQQRIMAKCKIHPNVKMSELHLAFADPKAQSIGNFNVDDAFNAQREPLIFVDHPADIITWNGDDPQVTFREMTKKKTFHQNDQKKDRKSSTDMLHWEEMTNQEFNSSVTRKRPPPKGGVSDPLRSNIVFNDDLCLQTASQTIRTTAVNAARQSMPDLLKWSHAQKSNAQSAAQKGYHLACERFRHDDRVPYTDC